MADPNPFREQCPNCHSYKVSLFAGYIVLWEVIVAGILTFGVGLLIGIPLYIISVLKRINPYKNYTCLDCNNKWEVYK